MSGIQLDQNGHALSQIRIAMH